MMDSLFALSLGNALAFAGVFLMSSLLSLPRVIYLEANVHPAVVALADKIFGEWFNV
jgi:hypothetical protein